MSDFLLDTLVSHLPLVVLLCVIAVYYFWKNHGLPPGPKGVPLLGFAPFFGAKPPHTFLALKEKYGKLFSMYMGPQLTIVLNDYEAIKEAYLTQSNVFGATADAFIFRYLSAGDDGKMHGILLAEGEPWRVQKKFMTQTFRELGVGKARLEERVLEEAELLCSLLEKHVGKPFNPSVALSHSTANVICWLCFGRRFDPADPVFGKVFDDLLMISDDLAQSGALQAFPVLRFAPGPLRTIWKRFERVTFTNRAFNNEMIKQHQKTYDPSVTRDYIDAFLHQQRREKQDPNADMDKSVFNHDDLLTSLGVFFGTATETTSVTLQWILLFLISHPEVQDRIQEEIDNQIGKGRSVTLDDRDKLPYLEATCHEVQRLANVTPFGVLRSNVRETQLFGYRIPKRSFIMPNFIAVHMDPSLWDAPEEFRPERFLRNGQVYEPPYFMPFSIGKRTCIGESLARTEIFLFVANLLQRYQFRAPRSSPPPPTTEYVSGISSRPLPYKVEIQPR